MKQVYTVNPEKAHRYGGGINSHFKFRIKLSLFLFLFLTLSALHVNAVEVVISGPTTVCPRNAPPNTDPHTFTAKSFVSGTSIEVGCSFYWVIKKDGMLLDEVSGNTLIYTFNDVGTYEIIAFTTSCPFPFSSGNDTLLVNSRVKMPSPISGPTVCNTDQAYTFSSSPSLASQNPNDPDCYYHFAYLWTAPSGWDIDGEGNTAFTDNSVNITAPVGTPAGNYEISIQSSIPDGGGSPIQDNSWFSTPRTYSVRVGAFSSSEISVSGTVAVCGGNTYTYTANMPGGHNNGYSYNWTYPAGWVLQYSSYNIIQLYVPTNYSSYGTVRVSIGNGCGSPSPYTGLTVFPCSYLTSGNFLVYPNPAEGELNISYFEENEASQSHTLNNEGKFGNGQPAEVNFQIELYNNQEELVRSAASKSGKINLNTTSLQPGTYFLQIRSGKEVFRKQVMIK